MDNIESVIIKVKNVDHRNDLMTLWSDVKVKIDLIRYKIDNGWIVESNIWVLYNLKRKIAAKKQLSFEYKCIIQMMLDRIEEVLCIANTTINTFNSPKIIKR